MAGTSQKGTAMHKDHRVRKRVLARSWPSAPATSREQGEYCREAGRRGMR